MLIKDKSLEGSAVNIKKIEKNSQYNFNSIEDLKKVSGIGDSIFEKIKDKITL